MIVYWASFFGINLNRAVLSAVVEDVHEHDQGVFTNSVSEVVSRETTPYHTSFLLNYCGCYYLKKKKADLILTAACWAVMIERSHGISG